MSSPANLPEKLAYQWSTLYLPSAHLVPVMSFCAVRRDITVIFYPYLDSNLRPLACQPSVLSTRPCSLSLKTTIIITIEILSVVWICVLVMACVVDRTPFIHPRMP